MHRRLSPILLGALLGTGAAGASTLVSPHALFINQETRSTVLYVQNTGHDPVEVSVELQFGYPVSDSLGDVRVKLIEDPEPGEPSAAGWIRALPRRAILYPRERQAVRLLAQPPADLPDGEYWSRVLVMTRNAPEPRAATPDGRIQVGVTLQTRTILALSYRKGAVSTAVALDALGATVEDGNLVADVTLRREGNAAYLGDLELQLVDAEGKIVHEWRRAVAVYHGLFRRLTFPLEGSPPGRHRLELRLSTLRADIPAEWVLPAETVRAAVELTVP